MEKAGMSRTSAVICKVTIPAVSKVVTKQVVATPAASKTVSIPATYKTVKVTKLVTPETTKKTVIPATYKTVSKQVKVSDQSVKWMPVLCKSSMTIETISKIQKALTAAGFKTPVTGMLDATTKASVKAYQTKKGLTVSGLSIATLKDLGVL
jgi:peptidoglycan hydrolase-like protein with peptidoglycan-binding domain